MPRPSTSRQSFLRICGLVLLACIGHGARAQDLPLTTKLHMSDAHPLDLSKNVSHPQLEREVHQPLPEEYIWTAADTAAESKLVYTFPGIGERTEPHFFRAHFRVGQVPPEATLYVAGPRSVSVWINGQQADRVSGDLGSPLNMHVFKTPVAKYLKPGENVIALQAVRGRGVTGFANSALVRQQTFGQVLAVKILPAAPGVEAPDLMHSDRSWKSTDKAADGWESTGFADKDWKPVMSLGGIESSIELFQWNADAGLYDWPGYDGISGFLAHMPVPVTEVLATFSGRGRFEGLNSLSSGKAALRVFLPAEPLQDADAPTLFLDFGRELTGRLELVSDTDRPVTVTVQLGESESEALKDPYLGVNQITIAPHSTGHSPKSAFRFAKIRFLGGAQEMRFTGLRVDHVFYPVQYEGSFESSDPLLNRIWETGAYTAHLCMQDGVWDASKRDRGRWMGDTDVSGPVIEEVFGDRMLLEDTLDRLLGPDATLPVDQHVNGIPGYSSFWFTGVADFYRHTGDAAFLHREHERMLQLLAVVDREFDERGIYANKSQVWLYVDWSPELNGDTPETRRATTLEFLRAYREAAFLLHEAGDETNAKRYEQRAADTEAAARRYLQEPSSGTFGPRWQTNAAAVISGAATPEQYEAIWRQVLSQVGRAAPAGSQYPILSPYYGAYVLRAMAQMNHRADAVNWMRQYWGGMLAEGATSFWEAYNTDWYKEDFHSSLQADNRSGYFVSLAHGWSAGPTAWLTEEVLGVKPKGPGFSTVSIRPDLLDLSWARGSVATPRGALKVSARKQGAGTILELDLPPGTVANVSIPTPATSHVQVNGQATPSLPAEGGTRCLVTLRQAGHFTVKE